MDFINHNAMAHMVLCPSSNVIDDFMKLFEGRIFYILQLLLQNLSLARYQDCIFEPGIYLQLYSKLLSNSK